MSEYYKIIEKIECILTCRYCVHDAPYCFSGFFWNWDRRRTSTPCAFHLPWKWQQIPIHSRNYASFYMWGMKIQPKGSSKLWILISCWCREGGFHQTVDSERYLRRSSKGKIRNDPCLSHNENHGLKTSYVLLHLKWLWRQPLPLDLRCNAHKLDCGRCHRMWCNSITKCYSCCF